MTGEELERAIAFIIEQQAQFAANQQRHEETMHNHEEFMRDHEAAMRDHDETLRRIEGVAEQEINLDSLRAYLNAKMPNRKHSDSMFVSQLVNELRKAGYKSIGDVDRLLDSTSEAFKFFENDHNPDRGYADVGVVRMSACIADDNYLRIRAKGSKLTLTRSREKYGKYKHLLK